MSQTSTYGDSLISGILAGQKMKQFQSDLQTSELQRQLLEQTFQHNAVMQPLMVAHQQAQTQNEQITNQGLLLANELHKQLFKPTAEKARAEASKAKSEADVAKETKRSQIDYTKARTRGAEAEARGETIRALHELGGTLAGSHSFTDDDLATILEQNQFVGTAPADQKLMTQWLRQGIEQGQQRLDENKARIGSYQEQINFAKQQKMTQDFIALSDLASQNPEGFAASKEQLQGMYPPALVEAAEKLGVESSKRRAAAAGNTTITSSPGETKMQDELGKHLGELITQLGDAKREKALLDKGRSLSGSEASWFSTDSTDRKRLAKEAGDKIDALQSQIDEIRTQLTPVEKKIEKNGKQSSTTELSYPKEVIEWVKKNKPGSKLPPPTPELISQWTTFVKNQK